jgi:hypothetical protein
VVVAVAPSKEGRRAAPQARGMRVMVGEGRHGQIWCCGGGWRPKRLGEVVSRRRPTVQLAVMGGPSASQWRRGGVCATSFWAPSLSSWVEVVLLVVGGGAQPAL